MRSAVPLPVVLARRARKTLWHFVHRGLCLVDRAVTGASEPCFGDAREVTTMNKITTVFQHCGAMLLLASCTWMTSVASAQAESAIEFPGTVLTVDHTTGKFAVKKDSGGTRFTFIANDKTKFQGTGLASLKDLQKDDKVVVLYHVQGSQYLAISVTKQ
jgi:hypothetical protein